MQMLCKSFLMSEEFEGHDTDYPILLLLLVFFICHSYLENVQGMSQEKQIIINMIFAILKVVCILYVRFGTCGSSAALTLCRSSCIACRQKVSRRCVKACETSDHWGDWKRSCTAYIQMAVLQCG